MSLFGSQHTISLATASGLAVLTVFSCGANLTAANKFPAYPVRDITSYTVNSTAEGVIVAVEALRGKKDQKTYFGSNLTDGGVLPVFLVIRNDSDQSYMFDASKVTYSNDLEDFAAASGERKSGKLVAGVAVGALSIGGMIVAAKMAASAAKVRQNLLRKKMYNATVSPGKEISGFIYVPLDKKNKSGASPLWLNLVLQPVMGGTVLEFQLQP